MALAAAGALQARRLVCFVGGYSAPRQADPFGGTVGYADEGRVCAGVGCVALWGDGRIDRGALRAPTPAGANPSYVLAGPADTHGTRVLYVANEFTRGDVAGGGDEPGVRALEVVQDADGATLRPLGAPVPTGGDLPCHVALGAGGGVLCVSHYGVGGVAGVEVGADGALGAVTSRVEFAFAGVGPDSARQEASHAHSVELDPLRPGSALVCDLGADTLHRLVVTRGVLAVEKDESSPPVATPPGGGPRSLAWHPSGRFAYVVLEMAAQVAVYRRAASAEGSSGAAGALELVGVSPTLPEGWPAPCDEPSWSRNRGRWAADVAVTPDGRFAFVSNRLHDSIARFAVDATTGLLSLLGHTPCGGACPRCMRLCAGGALLVVANQHSHSVATFRVDAATGDLELADALAEFPNASCVEVVELPS